MPQFFLITITAQDSRESLDSYHRTRILHLGFLMAESQAAAQAQADAMCKELEKSLENMDPVPFSAQIYASEHTYRATVAGAGDLIRVGEFDD